MAATEARTRTPDTVTSYLGSDHAEIDAALGAVAAAVGEGRFDAALNTYAGMERGLRRHMRIEEELLFPVFEARSGVGGPTSVMRDEHRQIRVALTLMGGGLDQRDGSGFAEGLRFMRSVMPDHNAKEEHILYPTLDRLLSDAERSALVARLRRE
jgi:iron-sulfur cluster repair protein YtfE (RIC family)